VVNGGFPLGSITQEKQRQVAWSQHSARVERHVYPQIVR
jgi:hypothetical protein